MNIQKYNILLQTYYLQVDFGAPMLVRYVKYLMVWRYKITVFS